MNRGVSPSGRDSSLLEGTPPSSALLPFLVWVGGFPYENRLQRKTSGTLILTSLLEDLETNPSYCGWTKSISQAEVSGGQLHHRA